MTAPILELTNCCCQKVTYCVHPHRAALGNTAIIFDGLIVITGLVLGILGTTAVIGMPASAAYGLFGVSGGIALLYIAALVKLCIRPSL